MSWKDPLELRVAQIRVHGVASRKRKNHRVITGERHSPNLPVAGIALPCADDLRFVRRALTGSERQYECENQSRAYHQTTIVERILSNETQRIVPFLLSTGDDADEFDAVAFA